jgi:hypothetical protein
MRVDMEMQEKGRVPGPEGTPESFIWIENTVFMAVYNCGEEYAVYIIDTTGGKVNYTEKRVMKG